MELTFIDMFLQSMNSTRIFIMLLLISIFKKKLITVKIKFKNK
jgi:hypothetical protein